MNSFGPTFKPQRNASSKWNGHNGHLNQHVLSKMSPGLFWATPESSGQLKKISVDTTLKSVMHRTPAVASSGYPKCARQTLERNVPLAAAETNSIKEGYQYKHSNIFGPPIRHFISPLINIIYRLHGQENRRNLSDMDMEGQHEKMFSYQPLFRAGNLVRKLHDGGYPLSCLWFYPIPKKSKAKLSWIQNNICRHCDSVDLRLTPKSDKNNFKVTIASYITSGWYKVVSRRGSVD